jgi:hypothetical protein
LLEFSEATFLHRTFLPPTHWPTPPVMARLVRTSTETRDRKRQLLLLVSILVQLAMLDEVESAAYVFQAVVLGARLLHGPSRSWANGINTVSFWSFENMYHENVCWEYFRWRKADLPEFAQLLQLPEVIVTERKGCDQKVFPLCNIVPRL